MKIKLVLEQCNLWTRIVMKKRYFSLNSTSVSVFTNIFETKHSIRLYKNLIKVFLYNILWNIQVWPTLREIVKTKQLQCNQFYKFYAETLVHLYIGSKQHVLCLCMHSYNHCAMILSFHSWNSNKSGIKNSEVLMVFC